MIISIICPILQIILFFKIWIMTDDIRAIKNKYLNSNNEKTDFLITNIGENETALSEEKYNGFRLGELVVLKSNGRQMRIKSYNSVTDTFDCYTSNYSVYEGSFKPDELSRFYKG